MSSSFSTNTVLKYNRRLLDSIKTRRRKFRGQFLGNRVEKIQYNFPPSNPWINKAIRDDLTRYNRNTTIKMWLIMTLFVAVVLFLLLKYF